MIVGVVADTHAFLDPRLVEALGSVDAIVHAGDVGGVDVLKRLAKIAPLYAVAGNNDVPLGGLGLPEHLDVEIDGAKLHVVHQRPEARPAPGTNVIIFGHSHRQVSEWRDGVLYLNPGAAGRRGFHALQTAALLHIENGVPRPEPVILGPRIPQESPRPYGEGVRVRGSARRGSPKVPHLSPAQLAAVDPQYPQLPPFEEGRSLQI
jgi:hypothetical protein